MILDLLRCGSERVYLLCDSIGSVSRDGSRWLSGYLRRSGSRPVPSGGHHRGFADSWKCSRAVFDAGRHQNETVSPCPSRFGSALSVHGRRALLADLECLYYEDGMV